MLNLAAFRCRPASPLLSWFRGYPVRVSVNKLKALTHAIPLNAGKHPSARYTPQIHDNCTMVMNLRCIHVTTGCPISACSINHASHQFASAETSLYCLWSLSSGVPYVQHLQSHFKISYDLAHDPCEVSGTASNDLACGLSLSGNTDVCIYCRQC